MTAADGESGIREEVVAAGAVSAVEVGRPTLGPAAHASSGTTAAKSAAAHKAARERRRAASTSA